jgi:hypothetical protein
MKDKPHTTKPFDRPKEPTEEELRAFAPAYDAILYDLKKEVPPDIQEKDPSEWFRYVSERLPQEKDASEAKESFPCPACQTTLSENEDACRQCGWTFMK